MTGFKAISFTEEKVGKHIKASKKKYSWIAMIDSNELRVELFVSKLSRKVKLFVNKDLVHHGKIGKGNLLQFSQEFFGRQVHVLQQGKLFDLRVDSVSFQHIYQQNRNKEEFRYEFQSTDLRNEDRGDDSGEAPSVPIEEKPKKAYNPFDEPQTDKNPFDEPQRTYNPFDELFEQPMPVKETQENKQKLKPFAIKPPGPANAQPKGFGIFQAPELQPVKTNLDGNLFENPSKPVNNTEVLKFPEAENPFMTGNFNRAGPQMGNQFYTGNYYK